MSRKMTVDFPQGEALTLLRGLKLKVEWVSSQRACQLFARHSLNYTASPPAKVQRLVPEAGCTTGATVGITMPINVLDL